MRRSSIFVVMLCAVQLLSAQIRIIPQAELLKAQPKAAENSPLRFQPTEVDFGTIDEMSGVWQGSAKLVNTGADTVAITQIKSTCGCLEAELPKRVVAPKESVKVALKYYPRGHAGRVAQRVLIYTNGATDRPASILQLKGLVTASEDRSDDYPYSRGTLRLRQDMVRFESEGRQVVRVACMNGGSTMLRPQIDTLLTYDGLLVRFEPTELAPKAEGYMVVTYTPTDKVAEGVAKRIYLKLPGVSPRHGVVEVLIGDK